MSASAAGSACVTRTGSGLAARSWSTARRRPPSSGRRHWHDAGAAAPELTGTQRRVLIALCRPYASGQFATPATNQEIAAELFLSTEAVKTHLRSLFAKFALGELPQNQKRARLAELALQSGAISHRELAS